MKKTIAVVVTLAMTALMCVSVFGSDHIPTGVPEINPTQIHGEDDVTEGDWAKEPTCTEDGIWRYPCSEDSTKFHEVVIPANGHTWSSDVDGVNWGKVVKEPTCTEEGEAIDYCVDCGEENADHVRVMGTKPHDFEYEEISFKKATCVAKGEEKGHNVCTVCGAVEVDANGKEIVEVDTWDWTDPGEEDDDFNEAHRWDKWVTEKTPTCADEGLRVRWCKRCGSKEEETIDTLEPDYQILSSRLLDCYTEETTYRCALCSGDVHDDYTETTETRAHSFKKNEVDEEKSLAPTCFEWGYDIIKCDHYDDLGNDTDKHDEIIKTVVKTNDDRGTTYTTEIPYYEGYKTVELAPTGHQWTNWVKRHAAGEADNEYGYWIRTCKVCGLTDELVTGEDVVEVIAPTCTEDGKKIFLDGSEEIIPATGHTEVEIPAIEPTVDSVGFTAGTKCSVCDEILVAPEEIPALKDGFVKDEDGKWRLYENGAVKEDFTGIYSYNGGEFYLDKGVLQDGANGLNLVNGTWYFLSQGQVQRKDGFAEYDDNWFMIDNGELDSDANGLYTYKTDEGEGVFLFAAGRLRRDVNGLWQDHYGTYGAKDKWYFLANGQVVDYTGVAEYNGAFFVVEKGVFNDSYNGTIEYDGATFKVVNGQLYGKAA